MSIVFTPSLNALKGTEAIILSLSAGLQNFGIFKPNGLKNAATPEGGPL